LGLLAPQPAGLAGGLDGGLLDVGHGPFEFVGVACADGDEACCAEDAVSGGEVGFLLEDVVVLSELLGVVDLADPLTLCGVGDVFGLLLRMSRAAWSVRIGV
jgi:hypothetical protein